MTMFQLFFFTERTESSILLPLTAAEFKLLPFQPAFNKHEETSIVIVNVQQVVV